MFKTVCVHVCYSNRILQGLITKKQSVKQQFHIYRTVCSNPSSIRRLLDKTFLSFLDLRCLLTDYLSILIKFNSPSLPPHTLGEENVLSMSKGSRLMTDRSLWRIFGSLSHQSRTKWQRNIEPGVNMIVQVNIPCSVADGIWIFHHVLFLFQLIEAKCHIYTSVNKPSLVQIMAFHLVGTKPLSEPILEY